MILPEKDGEKEIRSAKAEESEKLQDIVDDEISEAEARHEICEECLIPADAKTIAKKVAIRWSDFRQREGKLEALADLVSKAKKEIEGREQKMKLMKSGWGPTYETIQQWKFVLEFIEGQRKEILAGKR